MKAAVYRKYGPPEVLRIEDVEKPVPADDDVLVRIVASTVCSGDWRLRRPSPIFIGWFMNGFGRPKKINILGMEFAGTVDSIGKNVTRFKLGDRVFGGSWRFGAHAEYACFAERSITKIPNNVSFEEAAAIPYGGVSALYFLKKAGIKAGHNVLIYGASGSVGTAAVQLAKYFGAHVTAACSTANLGLVRSIGADAAIDYTKEDFSKAGRIYDIIQDTVGKRGFWRSRRALKPGGVFIDAGPGPSPFFGGLWAKMTGAGTVIGTVAQGGVPALDFLAGLVEQGTFRPVIDRRYPLADIAEAHRYAEAGHKKGNVVINVASNDAGGLSVPSSTKH
jgi:NADPH:quinone reductase-like Zn-dependent oxidoreductase